MGNNVHELFNVSVRISNNFIRVIEENVQTGLNQKQTQEIFSDKWAEADNYKDIEKLYHTQYEWFLKLYGFDTEHELVNYLATKKYN